MKTNLVLAMPLMLISAAWAQFQQPMVPIQPMAPMPPMRPVPPLVPAPRMAPVQPLPPSSPVQPLQLVQPSRPAPAVPPVDRTALVRQAPVVAPWSGGNEAKEPLRPAPKSALGVLNGNPSDPDSLSNRYGAGSPHKADGLMNPYSRYGSPYSEESATNPYATNPPKLVDSEGNYLGELTANPHRKDSISNPYGRYGNPSSPLSVNNPNGPANAANAKKIYVIPADK